MIGKIFQNTCVSQIREKIWWTSAREKACGLKLQEVCTDSGTDNASLLVPDPWQTSPRLVSNQPVGGEMLVVQRQ